MVAGFVASMGLLFGKPRLQGVVWVLVIVSEPPFCADYGGFGVLEVDCLLRMIVLVLLCFRCVLLMIFFSCLCI